MDYSSIVYPCISVTNLKILEKIQFKCLKIINRKSKYASNSERSSVSGYVSIEERFDELNLKNIKKNINNNNELLIDLYNDYLNYSNSRQLKNRTLFCKYKFDI